jgi:delta-aminolevulinic acid dehydratase/porphobilinogen synthase
MKYRRLGDTGLHVSQLCLGAMTLALEHLTAIKRAGADIILTYYARWFAERVRNGSR